MAPSPRKASVASGAGSNANVESGGVELHEFRIADYSARSCGEGHAVSLRGNRVGRDRVKPAEPASGEDGFTSVKGGAFTGLHIIDERAADRAMIVRQQIFDDNPFKNSDVFARPSSLDQRLHDRDARLVARGVDNPVAAMGGFAAKFQFPLLVAVKNDAEPGEVFHRRRTAIDQQAGGFRVNQPGAGFHCVREVKVRRIIRADRCSHAPLRPRG